MKFEKFLLQSLFSASLLVCLLVLGSMLTSHVPATQLANAPAAVATATSAAG
jgi:hypothetical protein